MTKNPWCRLVYPAMLAIAFIGVAPHAGAQEKAPQYVDAATRLRFPATLAELRFETVRDFGNPNLGYCAVYRGGDALGQICVYDLGHRDLPTGIDSTVFRDALGVAVDATLRGFSSGPFRNGQLIAEGTPAIEVDGKIAMAEMRMFTSETERENAVVASNWHLILMTTGLGKILKLNYTSTAADSEQFIDQSKAVLVDFIGYNEPLMKQLLAARKK